MRLDELVAEFKRLGKPGFKEGMARFAIPADKAYGVPVPELRKLAKRLGTNQKLAQELWNHGSREARLLAGMIADQTKLTEKMVESWAAGFDGWEVCDQACMNLFWKADFAYKKAAELAGRKSEFVKRTGFALMAVLAWKDKQATDQKFEQFFPLIEKQSWDERNFVKKAVNWALRQIGKRNRKLNKKAIALAERIRKQDTRSAKWIAADALRELRSEAVQNRLSKKH